MLKLKKAVAFLLSVGMVGSSLGVSDSILANNEGNIDSSITYVVVEKAAVELGQTQEILVGTNQGVLDASLYFENVDTKQTYEMNAAQIQDESVLFSYAYTDQKMQGEYELSEISLELEDHSEVTYDLDQVQIQAGFGLGEVVDTSPDAYTIDEATYDAIESSQIVATDGEGKVLSQETLAQALVEASNETTDQTSLRATSSTPKIVVLDPGHDATHKGTQANSLSEEVLTLKIAQYCKAELELYQGVVVYMTRDSEKCPYPDTSSSNDNAKRVTYANSVDADIYVAIHLNSAASSKASGAEVYYPNSNGENKAQKAVGSQGKSLAQDIEDELVALGLEDKGIKIRDSESGDSFSDKTLKDYYGVIRKAKTYEIPAVIVEHCFQSSTSDAKKFLQSESGLKKLGKADATGIAKYLDLTKGIAITYAQGKDSNTIKIVWNKQAKVSGYYLYRSSTKTGGYQKIATIKSADTTKYEDTSLSAATTYYYKVKAYGDSQTYKASGAVAGRTLSAATLNQPRSSESGTVTLSWKKQSDITGYLIYQSKDNKTFTKVKSIKDPATTSTSLSVSPGEKYYYKIRAYKKGSIVNDYGSYSSVKKVVSPIKTKGKAIWGKTTSATISWDKVSGSGYEIYRSNQKDKNYQKIATVDSSSSLSYTDQKLDVNCDYYYKVRAFHIIGGVTNLASFSDAIQLQAKSPVQITKTYAKAQGKMQLTWCKVKGAKGYEVYRSTKEGGSYTKIASVGSSVTTYTNTSLKDGQNYYYKVRAKLSSGYTTFSEIKKARCVEKAVIWKMYSISDKKMKITWDKVSGASGYILYRKNSYLGSYKKIATIQKGSSLSYTDTGLSGGKKYYYKVKAYVDNNGTIGTGATSKGRGLATYTKSTTITKAVSAKSNDASISWKKVSSAAGYYIYRSKSLHGTYSKVGKVVGNSSLSFKDTTTSGDQSYYYCVRPYEKGYNGNSGGKVSSPVKVEVLKTVEIKKIKQSTDGMVLNWGTAVGADGYQVYVSTDGKKYKKLASVKGAITYTDTTSYDSQKVYYKIRAYAKQLGGTGYGSFKRVGGYKIMLEEGQEQNVTVAQLVAFYQASKKTYPASVYKKKGAKNITAFCKIVYNEAKKEGVKAEVLFAQICLETAYLQFGGDVKASQCNFGGLGATDGSGGSISASFDTVTLGIRAQVQHLKAYGCSDKVSEEIVDTRFKLVTRGISPFVETLSIATNPANMGWASDKDYGTKLMDNIQSIKQK